MDAGGRNLQNFRGFRRREGWPSRSTIDREISPKGTQVRGSVPSDFLVGDSVSGGLDFQVLRDRLPSIRTSR